MDDNQFSVVQFFNDGSHEYVRRDVTVEEAAKAALHYTNSVAVKAGLVSKVVIIDSGDRVCFEWQAGIGIIDLTT